VRADSASRSVLCLPIVKQTKLIGAHYLENNWTPGAFTPERLAVLEMWLRKPRFSGDCNLYLISCPQRGFLAQRAELKSDGQFRLECF